MRILKILKRIYCEHIYGDAVMNPFVDEHNQHSAIYTCIKCGHKQFVTFGKK